MAPQDHLAEALRQVREVNLNERLEMWVVSSDGRASAPRRAWRGDNQCFRCFRVKTDPAVGALLPERGEARARRAELAERLQARAMEGRLT